MLDIKYIREHQAEIAEGARRKRIDFDIDALLAIDEKRRALHVERDQLREQLKTRSKAIGQLKGEEKQAAIAETGGLSKRAKEVDAELTAVSEEFNQHMLRCPNPPGPEVPTGESDADNVVLREVGDIRQFGFEPKDHVELGEQLDCLDIPRGVKLSGSRNYILKRGFARLHLAVLRFALDHLIDQGFVPMIVPQLVSYDCMTGTGYFPFGEDQAYLCERDELALIGTSEVPLASYHGDEILEEAELPKHFCGYSSCYRREAGAAGKDTRGLYRIHQFDKIEQVVLCKNDPEESKKQHEFILANAEHVVQQLGVPYRVVEVCDADLGAGAIHKNDIECYMYSRNGYGETHSCSTLYEFQSRRLMLRYRDGDGKINYCHTLNNTCIASPRILISVIEHYQQEDGSVEIPAVLRPYMNGQDRITPPTQ